MSFFHPRSELQDPPVREDGLQIDEHPVLQRAYWRIERVSWVLFFVILLAAVAGLTGAGGILSRQTLLIGDAEVDLPRIARWQTAESMTVTFAGDGVRPVLRLGRSFTDYLTVEQILPEPRRSSVTDRGLELEFAASGQGLRTVSFGLRPKRPGIARFDIGVDEIGGRTLMIVVP